MHIRVSFLVKASFFIYKSVSKGIEKVESESCHVAEGEGHVRTLLVGHSLLAIHRLIEMG